MKEILTDKGTIVVDENLIPYNPNDGTNGHFLCLGELANDAPHNTFIMKKITLPQGTIVVDETAPINTDNIHVSIWYAEEVTNDGDYSIYKSEIGDSIENSYPIIASSFFISKDIPMYKEEDNVEQLAHKLFPQIIVQKHQKRHWIDGYKAAQSKGEFTENALRAVMMMVSNWIVFNKDSNEPVSNHFDRFIESIKDRIEFEMEEVCKYDGSCKKERCLTHPCDEKILQIKTTRDKNNQLWCKLK